MGGRQFRSMIVFGLYDEVECRSSSRLFRRSMVHSSSKRNDVEVCLPHLELLCTMQLVPPHNLHHTPPLHNAPTVDKKALPSNREQFQFSLIFNTWKSTGTRVSQSAPLGKMLTDAHASHKACGNSIPFTVHGIANCPGSLFLFSVILFLIFSLASQNILLMSSSVSLVSLKNIHNLVLPIGTLSTSIGSAPSSEGILAVSGGFSEGLGLGLSALRRATSIFGICTWYVSGARRSMGAGELGGCGCPAANSSPIQVMLSPDDPSSWVFSYNWRSLLVEDPKNLALLERKMKSWDCVLPPLANMMDHEAYMKMAIANAKAIEASNKFAVVMEWCLIDLLIKAERADHLSTIQRHQSELEAAAAKDQERVAEINALSAKLEVVELETSVAVKDFALQKRSFNNRTPVVIGRSVGIVLEISDDFGAFWRYLEQAPEMTIELDHRSILERKNRSIRMSCKARTDLEGGFGIDDELKRLAEKENEVEIECSLAAVSDFSRPGHASGT
ncbi:hypothetical protein DY000_02014932 [Brassica cretica]|uniref:Uncharacterized protein n=1 Tax=Brassica cretica TaxID=69181 RepID=A0ABQ7D997_BRACR|nr:hypothetical protein DY000_02014932 [Brassica cretica]